MRALALCLLLVAPALADSQVEFTTIRGHVLPMADEEAEPRLRDESGKVWTLAVETDAFHTLHDPKLADRTWEFVGVPQAGGSFDVHKLFTIKDGERFQVTYYCEICHIVSYRPGRCMCCQEPVELREIPAEK
ncbi:MAG: hypothetical protein GC160_00990 [Acidobacteria bacterium]|nr:hypothetical protein [Acidobacteriota bacterium]